MWLCVWAKLPAWQSACQWPASGLTMAFRWSPLTFATRWPSNAIGSSPIGVNKALLLFDLRAARRFREIEWIHSGVTVLDHRQATSLHTNQRTAVNEKWYTSFCFYVTNTKIVSQYRVDQVTATCLNVHLKATSSCGLFAFSSASFVSFRDTEGDFQETFRSSPKTFPIFHPWPMHLLNHHNQLSPRFYIFLYLETLSFGHTLNPTFSLSVQKSCSKSVPFEVFGLSLGLNFLRFRKANELWPLCPASSVRWNFVEACNSARFSKGHCPKRTLVFAEPCSLLTEQQSPNLAN